MFQRLLNTESFLNSIIYGVVIGFVTVFMSLSFSALIFDGALNDHLLRGFGALLFGIMITSVIMAIWGSILGIAISGHGEVVAIIAIATTKIMQEQVVGVDATIILPTILSVLIFSALSIGLIFFLIGYFRFGHLMHYIPYPVMGGVLGGMGVILILQGMELILGRNLELNTLYTLLERSTLLLLLPNVVGAFVITILLRSIKHILLWPAIIFTYVIFFYAVVLAIGISIDEARDLGLLLKPFSEKKLWVPFLLSDFVLVDWHTLMVNIDQLIPIPLIALITFLLDISSLELITKRNIDLDKELRLMGLANISTALFGGAPASINLRFTEFGWKSALSSVFTLTVGIFCAFILFFIDSSFILYIPIPFLGCFLMVIGFSFFVEWVYEAWFKVSLSEWLIVLSGLILIPNIGFLKGLLVGVVLATIIFILKYSSLDTVRAILTGQIYHAKVDRSAIERNILKCYGGNIHIFRLRGYIFFGTANQLLTRVRESFMERGGNVLFIIFDCHRIHGLDSSATMSFMRMLQMAEKNHDYLIFANMAPLIHGMLEKSGFLAAKEVHFSPTLDHAVEWCENEILRSRVPTSVHQVDIYSQLLETFPKPNLIKKLVSYLEKVEVEENYYLMRIGEPVDCMYFVESGQLDVLIETSEGKVDRLRSVRSGTIIGELGMYLKIGRTANVVTVCKSVLYRLSKKKMREMRAQDPETSSALHKWIICLMAERIADSNHAMEVLLD